MRKPIPQGKNILLTLIKDKESEVIPGKVYVPQANTSKSRLYSIVAVGSECLSLQIGATVCIGNNYPSTLDLDGENYYVSKESDVVAVIS